MAWLPCRHFPLLRDLLEKKHCDMYAVWSPLFECCVLVGMAMSQFIYDLNTMIINKCQSPTAPQDHMVNIWPLENWVQPLTSHIPHHDLCENTLSHNNIVTIKMPQHINHNTSYKSSSCNKPRHNLPPHCEVFYGICHPFLPARLEMKMLDY